MGRRKKPVFRLTLFFISVVIASGSILAYLSVNNISNLKELTEKRVLEEQKNLGAAISDKIQNIVIELAGNASHDSIGLVEHSFVMEREGSFTRPWFIDGLEHSSERNTSARYRANLALAEKMEFVNGDLKKASSYYQASLAESANDIDSTKILNALARLWVKLDDGENSFTYYSTITSSFYAVCDPYGFPYVYYAIPQLISISDARNRNRILQEIWGCLIKMDAGLIPLNHSTRDILEQISLWIETEPAPHEQSSEIIKIIGQIENRLSFIDRNRDLIRAYVQDGNKDEIPLLNDSFHALNGNSEDGGELILIKLVGDTASGFSVVFDKLWGSISEQELIEDAEFEYEIEPLKRVNGMNNPESLLATSSEVLPYFPGYQVLISLKNESLIDEFVKRRSWIYGIALILLLGGMVLGILLILRDISREEHLSRLRADFISNVTHELKTPLTSIQLFAESIVLNRIKTTAHRKEYMQIILKETESLKRMINNILDFSRKEKGKQKYNFEEVNVTLLLNEAIHDLEYWLVEKNFVLVKEIEEHVTSIADREALKQAIINLLNNAIKFSIKKKEICVRLKKEHEMVMIQVEDKGIGIPEDQREIVFQPFYRVGQKNAEDISGTGLGLSVVKEIVEAHRGKILVDSQLNKGSTFTILFKSTLENSV